MKQMISFALIGLTVLACLYSCKKDDTDNNSTPSSPSAESIAGKWQFVSVSSNKVSGYDVDMASGTGFFQDKESGCAKGSTLTFTETGASTGSVLIFDNCAQSNDEDNWILQNNVLTTQGMDFNVAQLDNAAFRIYRKGGRTGKIDPNNPNQYVWTDYIDTLTFKRN